jgi:hypothetical protein
MILDDTASRGGRISRLVSQAQNEVVFSWSTLPGAAPTLGYSVAIDGTPDATLDTGDTTYSLGPLANSPTVFSVRAIDGALNAGPVASFEVFFSAPSTVPLPNALLLGGGMLLGAFALRLARRGRAR